MKITNSQQNIFTKIYGDKNFVKKMLKIFVPIAIQSLISILVIYVDNFSLALLIKNKEEATAAKTALGLTTPVINFLYLMMVGWFSGISVMMAQYFGSGNQTMTRKTTAVKLWTGLLLLLPFFIINSTMTGKLISVTANVNQGLEFELAKTYLWIMGFSFISHTISKALILSLQETKKVGIGFVASVVGMATNIILDPIVIIFSKDVEQAVTLVAITTCLARTIQVVFVILYIIIKKNNDIRFFKEWYIKWSDLKMIISKGLGVFVNELIFALGTSILVVCFLWFDVNVHSATTNVVVIDEITTMLWSCAAAASSILVGAKLGKNEIEKAKENGKKIIFWNTTIGIIIGLIIFGLSWFINPILSPSASNEINEIGKHMMWVLAAFTIIKGTYTGAYYSIKCGGTRLMLWMDIGIIIIWTIIATSVTITNNTNGWNPVLVYFFIEGYQILKVVLVLIIYKRHNWAKVLVNIKTKNDVEKIDKENNLKS